MFILHAYCGRKMDVNQFNIEEIPPRCPDCNGLTKSDTAIFGEPIPRDILNGCFRGVEKGDSMIMARVSATVAPVIKLSLNA